MLKKDYFVSIDRIIGWLMAPGTRVIKHVKLYLEIMHGLLRKNEARVQRKTALGRNAFNTHSLSDQSIACFKKRKRGS
jgi:hypothetical protein